MSKDKQLQFQRFGKYLLLDHIVDGGMAKIWRARFLGEQANKIVAIKMIQAQFSEDQAFRQMFEDELRLAFGLIHPNIAQTYDYGIIDDQLFTAMEYVDGANLKQYMDRLKKRNFVFPVEISSHIITQVCQALQYAHTFTDKLSGKSLNIIHRDISPHNIMLTYDGAVKVIDFGIAKSDSNSEATQAGTIKGKLAYLAPEYLEGLELDCRYDIFAVGITFWELLCNKRLFQAKNDLAVLKQIQNCEIPAPSSINPNVPKELDKIVLKALSKDRNDRYENMDQFNRAVVRFLYAKYPEFNPTDLAYFSNELFKDDISEDRKKLVKYGAIDISNYLVDIENDVGGIAVKGKAPRSVELNFERQERVELDFEEAGSSETLDLPSNKTSNSITSSQINMTSTRRVNKIDKTITSINSRTMQRSRKKNSTSKKKSFLVPIVAAMLAVFVVYKTNILGRITKISDPISSKKSQNSIEKTLVYLDGFKPLMKVFIDGEEVEYSDFSGLKLEVGKKMMLTVEQAGRSAFETYITLSKSDTGKTINIPEMKAGEYGLLTTSRNFPIGSRLRFTVKGKKVDKKLPLDNMRVPAGVYNGVIIDPILKTKKRVTFEIEPSKKLFLRN